MWLITDVRFARKVNDFSYTKRAKVSSCIARAVLPVENLAIVRGYATSGMHRVYETSKVSGKTNLKLNIEIKREMKR